ncbi:unnamed protein product [Paramecium sonneborni]|uniref:Transmembrane protein n=1 Tax=Paramecium sonneborni TaxID=65129 RepID=A0A8S1R012_9CILI|nr:unnamed protein product [Paramecium sonneborni]
MSEERYQTSKQENVDKQEEIVHRNVKKNIENKKQINNEEKDFKENSQPESRNYLTIIIYGLIILGLIGGSVLGYKILKAGNVQDEEQMDFFVQTISQTLLNDLRQQKLLIIEEQKKQLQNFYEKQFSNIHWQKIVKYIQQQPNVIVSQDKKKWIQKE